MPQMKCTGCGARLLTAAINENTSHSEVSLEINDCTGVFVEICDAPHFHKCPECQNLHECFFGRCQGKETGNCADCREQEDL